MKTPTILLTLVLALSACESGGPSLGQSPPATRERTGQPAPAADHPYETMALLFTGSGTWKPEVTALRELLDSHGATYQEATSTELDTMSLDELSRFGVLVFPGGSGGTEADSLSAETHARLRTAVQERGVSYIGFCAGAYIAVAPAPALGQDVSYGLGIVDGPLLDDYSLAHQGVDYQMTLETFADGSTRDLLWYGGPITPNTGVIARYPDGNPAISEMWSGTGFVILSGPHPSATSSVLAGLGLSSSDGTHTEFAWELITAALNRTPLPSF